MKIFSMSLTLIIIGVTIATAGGLLNLYHINALGMGIVILFFVIAGIAGYAEKPTPKPT